MTTQFREKENIPGVVFDANDKRRLFVEDLESLEGAVNNLEAGAGELLRASNGASGPFTAGFSEVVDSLVIPAGAVGSGDVLQIFLSFNTFIANGTFDVQNLVVLDGNDNYLGFMPFVDGVGVLYLMTPATVGDGLVTGGFTASPQGLVGTDRLADGLTLKLFTEFLPFDPEAEAQVFWRWTVRRLPALPLIT